MAKGERKCVFCRERPADSREHALALWLHPYFDPTGTGTFVNHYDNHAGEPVRVWESRKPDIKAKWVCRKHCNNGWMSDLEKDVQPFVGSLLKGHGRTLYGHGQQLIACWAIKTALMWELATPDRSLPERWSAEIYEGRSEHRVPERVQVWIGAALNPGEAFFRSAPLTLTKKSGARANGYGVTFVIGRLVVQIFGHEFREEGTLRDIVPGTLLAHTMLQIWPYVGKVEMPPDFVMTGPQVAQLSKEFVGES